MNRIKYTLLFIIMLTVAVSSSIAQDPDIERLKKITGIIQAVNAIPVEFLRASPEFVPAGAANVNKQAALLKQLPPGTIVEIGVHTYAIGDEKKNVELTQQRAEKIRSMLIAAGIPASNLTAMGYGSSKPVVSIGADPKNRRTEYLITRLDTSLSVSNITFETSAIAQPGGTTKPRTPTVPKKIVDNKSGKELFDAVAKNQIDQVRDMIARGVGLNFEQEGETTLILAIRDRRTAIAKMLLEAGAGPEFAESKSGSAPIHWAVQMTEYDTLELLIEKYKVNVDQRTKSNNTPLHLAADFGESWGLTKVLLAAGANANVINNNGESPLDIARKTQKLDIVTTLEKVINTEEIARQKAAWARRPKASKPVQPASVVTPRPAPKRP